MRILFPLKVNLPIQSFIYLFTYDEKENYNIQSQNHRMVGVGRDLFHPTCKVSLYIL